ncbi:unnamed protein product [Rhizoctonia solani]|uniref:Transmembrane protein n=1 Tax=Rhizoctonia solani TaxID=456999 RepID=A0A8H3B1H9_9AGAM|nr:unnamed protein product [Rhizoctonia solani]
MESSSSLPDADQSPPRTAAEMKTKATTGCLIVFLAAVLAVVWHRRQRWRRTRPWLAKLRAEAASKIQKERSGTHNEPVRPNDLKEIPKDVPKDKANEKERKGKERIIPAETKSDGGSVGKRAKERRRRGKELKSTRMASAAPINDPQAQLFANKLDDTHAQPSHNSTPSAHLIPLPPSPILPAADQSMPPTLVLSPISPVSTSFSTSTEITAITPTTPTPVSSAPTSPAFPTNTNANTKAASSKLPSFPPASPLPPNLARKPPPLVRKSTPSLTSINTGPLNRKPSFNTERRCSKESEEAEFPTLNSWPTMTKDEPSARPKVSRKPSDAGRKDHSGRGRKPSDAKKVNGTSTPESTQIASLKGALEAARLREEEATEERRAWQKKERELQTQVNQLSHQLHALTIAFASGGGQGFPPYGHGYGMAYDPSQPTTPISKPELPSSEQVPMLDQSHTPTDAVAPVVLPSSAGTTRTHGTTYPTPYPYYPYAQYPPFMPPSQLHTHPQMIPTSTPMMSPPAQHGSMSPPQASPYLFSAHPWNVMHQGGSPMRSPIHAVPGMMHPIPGRHQHSGFYTGSPRRGGSRPRRQGTGTPSTPSVGSADDSLPPPTPDTTLPSTGDTWIPPRDGYIPLREDYVPTPPPPSGVKREREPETDEASSSSEDESDEDSVIFEDGSVSDSVNLSLHGGDSLRDKSKVLEVPAPVRIRVGEEVM